MTASNWGEGCPTIKGAFSGGREEKEKYYDPSSMGGGRKERKKDKGGGYVHLEFLRRMKSE